MVAFSSFRFSHLTAASLLVASALAVPSSYISTGALEKRQAQNSFAGTSNYYIAGLTQKERLDYLNTLRSYGSDIIRIWVAGASGEEKGSQLSRTVPEVDCDPKTLKMHMTLTSIVRGWRSSGKLQLECP